MLESLIPGIASMARGCTDVIESDGSHAVKAGPCARFDGLEQFTPPARPAGWLPDRVAAGQGPRRRSADQGHDSRSAGLSRMSEPATDRQTMDVDIVCVGFGPATAGFLTTLRADARASNRAPAGHAAAGDLLRARRRYRLRRFGRGDARPRHTRRRCPILTRVADSHGGGGRARRSWFTCSIRSAPAAARSSIGWSIAHDSPVRRADARVELPYVPPFLRKAGRTGNVHRTVHAVRRRAADGVGRGRRSGRGCRWRKPCKWMDAWRCAAHRPGSRPRGLSRAGYLPGMDVRAELTVVGDGPVGAVGRGLQEAQAREWAVGMKMVVDLPEGTDLEPGTVFHTFGYPEPEIFGFLYVHPDRVATRGNLRAVVVPQPRRAPPIATCSTSCCILISGGTCRAGRCGRGAPSRCRNRGGAASRVWWAKGTRASAKGRACTNHWPGRAWTRRGPPARNWREGVVELLQAGEPLSRENLENAYVARRRASWVEDEARIAESARDGFHKGLWQGWPGWLGRLHTRPVGGERRAAAPPRPGDLPGRGARRVARDSLRWPTAGEPPGRAADGRQGAGARRVRRSRTLPRAGAVPQVRGQAVHRDVLRAGHRAGRPDGVPSFDREKCIHCGACQWNCPDGDWRFRPEPGACIPPRTDSCPFRLWCAGGWSPIRCRRWSRSRPPAGRL